MNEKRLIEKVLKIKESLENKKDKQHRYNDSRNFFDEFGIIRRKSNEKLQQIVSILNKHGIFIIYHNEIITELKNIDLEESLILTMNKTEVEKLLDNEFRRTIKVVKGKNPRELKKHQADTLKELNKKVAASPKDFAGIIVMPTGAGKTFTAVNWILENYINKGKKVLWIAHRHLLLEQAYKTFRYSAYSDVLSEREDINIRTLSGKHDKGKHITEDDDILIASKDSIISNQKYYRKWLKSVNSLLLVIDEAHHAPARTYREIINLIKEQGNIETFHILGLTATPTRTAEKEKGLLKKIFKDDLIGKIGLKDLIKRGFLSEPQFEEIKTNFNITELLAEDAEKILDRVKHLDIDKIGEKIAKTIGENAKRNNVIVSQYVNKKDKYQQTIVFALNVANAIALDKLFNEKGIKSDYVVSNLRDSTTHANRSNEENERAIQRFKNKEIQVLINVNILTEGADIPQIKTVFLTRPTISSILMNQMIGRGLRGEAAGGTKETYIVSFIDDWKDKIKWVNPAQLVYNERAEFADNKQEYQKQIMRLVSIQKIQEFAQMADETIDTSLLETLEFIERIPIGLYVFSITETYYDKELDENIENTSSYDIMIYNHDHSQYQDFIEYVLKESKNEIDALKIAELGENKFFKNVDKLFGDRREYLIAIAKYIKEYEQAPTFIRFEDREKYNIDSIADEIFSKDMRRSEKKEYIDKLWDDNKVEWKEFFGYDQKYFRHEIDKALDKIENPKDYEKSYQIPIVLPEQLPAGEFTLHQLKEKDYDYYNYIREIVFEQAKDENGYYVCAKSGFKSKDRSRFHIDHKIPFIMSEGRTEISNLQLLERKENWRKGAKLD